MTKRTGIGVLLRKCSEALWSCDLTASASFSNMKSWHKDHGPYKSGGLRNQEIIQFWQCRFIKLKEMYFPSI